MLVEIPAPESATESRAARPSVTARLRGWLPPLLYLTPALLFLYLWTYRPLGQTFQLSFYNWDLMPTSPMTPAGTSNYTRVLRLPELGQAVWNTVVYIVALLPFTVLLPIAAALLARRVRVRARTVYQAMIFAPTLVTPVATAASVDGASRWQVTRMIILPLLSPTVLFLVLTTTLLSVQITFPLIDILTQGGPDGATTNVYYLLWQYGFRNFDAGFAGAAGTVFFLGFGLLAALFIRLSNKLSFYDN